jgi:hypothetical protein
MIVLVTMSEDGASEYSSVLSTWDGTPRHLLGRVTAPVERGCQGGAGRKPTTGQADRPARCSAHCRRAIEAQRSDPPGLRVKGVEALVLASDPVRV